MSHTYQHPRPAVTVDCVVFGKGNQGIHVLLIQRKNPPFQNCWALPGGFLDPEESPATAAARELEEETGLRHVPLKQFHTFGEPNRDPRGHTIAIAHYASVEINKYTPRAADDAADARWFDLNKLPQLAFDHLKIIETAIEHVSLDNGSMLHHSSQQE